MWSTFREKVLPNQQAWLDRHLGRPAPIEIDYDGFGEDRRAPESLGYLLEMLVRGLDPEPWDPYELRPVPVDRGRLHAGIERVRIRRARSPGEIELSVRDGCLHVASLGAFGPGEVECLLTERGPERLERWTSPPPPSISEDLGAMRRWRLAAVHRRLEWTLGRPIPIELEWESLDAMPNVREGVGRLVISSLEAVDRALRQLLEGKPALGPAAGARRAARREASRDVVARSIQGCRVRASGGAREASARFEGGFVEVVLGAGGHGIARERVLEAVQEALALDVEPLRRDLEADDVPKARAHLRRRLDESIASAGGRAPERLALRDLLGDGPEIAVDWPSFQGAGNRERVLEALAGLETGEYAHDREHGPYFQALFAALDEAIRIDPSFLRAFLERVRRIEVEHDPDPERVAIRVRGSSLVLRQGARGSIDPDAAREELVAAVLAMEDPAAGDGTAGLVARIAEILGVQVACRGGFDAAVLEDAARAVLGTLRSLARNPLARDALARGLESVELVPAAERAEARFERGTLRLLAAAGPTGPRLPDTPEIGRALDDGLALAAAGRIADWEASSRPSWEEMLAREENFGREIPIRVDWDAFLAAPSGGGNALNPYYVDDGGVKRLVYALTGWIADDPAFARRLREAVASIRVAWIPEDAEAALELDDGVLVLSVAARTYLTERGTMTIDEMQMRLGRLLEA